VNPRLTLPTDSAKRKRFPLRKGCFNYFPAALAGVAQVSMDGNDKHNPGMQLHHARGKSADHADCIDRHLTDVEDILAAIERNKTDARLLHADPRVAQLLTEANQLAWRALALSQELHEKYGEAPLAPAAALPPVLVCDPAGLAGIAQDARDFKPGAVTAYGGWEEFRQRMEMRDTRPPIHGPAGADWRSQSTRAQHPTDKPYDNI
jgi:hypothetical protein